MTAFLVFIVSASLVAGAGLRLARDGDVIAQVTGLGGVWIGAIVIAAATSLPELATDMHAVLQGTPDLALGDLFGSSMANLLILAVADQCTRHPRMLTRVALNQGIVGTLGIMLTALAALGLATASLTPSFSVGWAPPAIFAGYVAGMRLVHRNRPGPPFGSRGSVDRVILRKRVRQAPVGVLIAAVVILISAPYVAGSAAEIADQLSLSHGIVGAVLLAITTSLPEVAVSVGTIRLGAYDLAVGNLLGSNCFNMVLLLPLDLMHAEGPLLASVNPGFLIASMVPIVMTAIALLDILNKSERRIWKVEPVPAVMVVLYLSGLYVVHLATG